MKNLKSYRLFIAIIVIFFAFGCNKTVKIYENTDEMVADVKTRIKTITIEQFKEIMAQGDNYILLDCREPGEYFGACIPGAINIPRGLLEFKVGNQVQRGAEIFVYCKTGGRSALSAETLKKLKYSDVTSIEGGWKAWTKAYPDIQEVPTLEAGEEVPEALASDGGCGG